MASYIGIDLGTTNSAICSFDGQDVRIWKSPEQEDVTPSAIYVDRRGNRYYGRKAYNNAPRNPNNSATLFKRFMGTTNKIKLEAINLELTPEECSAEILKVLFGYLPEDIRNSDDTATVITVPAAFNQVKKDATLDAAKMAGIGRVALMQEPVAAIMNIMRLSKQNGLFLVYDLGGGTFDVSIAENINGKVSLLAHGGVEMCGGRDIDRSLYNQVVVPWLYANFKLPDDFTVNERYKTFSRLAQWATEQAKITLSSNETATVALDEEAAHCQDSNGKEMYLDIDITRGQLDLLMSDIIAESVAATRETLNKVGLTSNDIERVVFVGGPTNYKPLRDKIAGELSLKADFSVNPMTAVAEGASIFAESIDWSSAGHNRKASTDTIGAGDITFKYEARATKDTARVVCQLKKPLEGFFVRFTSKNNGWTTGNIPLSNNLFVDLPLSVNGENKFFVSVYDSFLVEQRLGIDAICVTKALATVSAIPASHSVGIAGKKVKDGPDTLQFIVKEGDSLPQKGTLKVLAGEDVSAGSTDSINITLWEGDITTKIDDNRKIGTVQIKGTDFELGKIPMSAEIEIEYEMSDSGTITLEASVPCVGVSIKSHNLYSRQEGQTDLDDLDHLAEEGQDVVQRVEQLSEKIGGETADPLISKAIQKAEGAKKINSKGYVDKEDIQKAHNELLEARKILDQLKKNHLKESRETELSERIESYKAFSEPAKEVEKKVFESLTESAERSIKNDGTDFDKIMQEMDRLINNLAWRNEWLVIRQFNMFISSPSQMRDLGKFNELKTRGELFLANGQIIPQLRDVVYGMYNLSTRHNRATSVSNDNEKVNIILS